jgi:4-amino-4-deoxy-L-arabinose transferase-like glycosyltransferase
MTSDGRWAGLLFAGALLIRIVTYLGTAIFGTDSGQFLLMADRMSEGRFHEALSVTYHPMYPLLAAGLKPFLGNAERAGFWISILLGSAAVVPLFLTVRAVFGRPAAFVTALLYAFHRYTVEGQADVMSEGTFVFFFFSTAWLVWRVMEQPGLDRAALAGLAAVAAYLTRPEGILAVALAVAWPVAEAIRRRDRLAVRLGGAAVTLGVVLVVALPFLLWVKSVKGHWALSAKWSVDSAGRAFEIASASPSGRDWGRYADFGVSMIRLMYYVGIPFYFLGLLGLRGLRWRDGLYFFSFPCGYLAGLLWALRSHPWMSHRYLLPAMEMLGVLAALGLLIAARFLARRWPAPRWQAAALGLVALVTVGPSLRLLGLRRDEAASLRDAAAWMRAQGPPERSVVSTQDQLGYLSGSKMVWYPETWDEFLALLQDQRPAFVAYTDKDLGRKPPYVDRLRECDRLAPAVTFKDPSRKGVWTVYVHRVQ